jgi:pentapeptide repeat protein
MLYRANLYWADLGRANLNRADLREVNLKRANLYEATLRGADLRGVRGAEHAFDIQTVRFTVGLRRAEHAADFDPERLTAIEDVEEPALGHDASYFDTCRRPWPERCFDWERLRIMGRLPLFGASYTVLILIAIVFYVLALYNDKIELIPDIPHSPFHFCGYSAIKSGIGFPKQPEQ